MPTATNPQEEIQDFKKMFNTYRDYILSDLNELEQIAEAKAQQEFDNFTTNWSSTLSLETTSSSGYGVALPNLFFGSRCTVPICFVAFSAMDFLGKLVEPIHRAQNKKFDISPKGFARNAQLFLYYLAGKNDLDRVEAAEKLENKYRHAIMHSFLPSAALKTGYSVAFRHFDLIQNCLFVPDHYNRDSEILNVKFLTEALKKGLAEFENILNEGKYTVELMNQYNEFLKYF